MMWVHGYRQNGYFQKFEIYSGKEGTQEAGFEVRVRHSQIIGEAGFTTFSFTPFFTSLKNLHLEPDEFYHIGFPLTLKTTKLTNKYNTFQQTAQVVFQFSFR